MDLAAGEVAELLRHVQLLASRLEPESTDWPAMRSSLFLG
jgi:hypothetical protein